MYRILKPLLPLFLFTMILLAARIAWSGELTFIFLPWNFFLALIPIAFAWLTVQARRKMGVLIYGLLWLLFLPNAPYLVTDLVHLKERPGIPLWYDLLLLATASVNGLLAGFISLSLIEKRLKPLLNRHYVNPLIFGLMLLSGFGIYLGRFQRWNSWDIITNPMLLLTDLMRHMLRPFHYPDAWLITTLFGTWLFIIYQYIKKHMPPASQKTKQLP